MFSRGIVCLPVHDSFIVQQQHEDALRESMIKWWTEVLHYEPVIDKKY